jgi:hypothetical protein
MAGVVASTAGNETSIKSSGWAAEMIRTVYPNMRLAIASTERTGGLWVALDADSKLVPCGVWDNAI